MNKKAQSEIITTVLIILLVIAAIVIVWQVINSTVNNSSKDITAGAACLDASVSVVKADVASKTISITREGGGPTDALKYTVYVDGLVVVPASIPTGKDTLLNFASAEVTMTTLVKDQKVAVALIKDGSVCGAKSLEVPAA